ncbi:hypothetical protein TCAL_11659 [Tigriopus californicus]|uniref:Ionotropic glutamate receptor L-glutamate and glycine-binding domain-containing protein n=1 Tax=Tigriopus californicus TaxID=6832 RepID=A0A553NCF4_TIGCA|nr:glutamate receptor ionotropic, kainate glr-3-like [Tigriopus californicus]TRY63126.1 hypothetical protein TCAL_11659 [Tigriopus californicus]|eukprot:TCALIF_11659-PA protein Name:"Similar to GRID1 Glutamate receptor ionotropic, delta-1 (Homo sapiens)" AED:0.41 eAED:0.41 QI:0/-1/0/1/-1/1/1/0/671
MEHTWIFVLIITWIKLSAAEGLEPIQVAGLISSMAKHRQIETIHIEMDPSHRDLIISIRKHLRRFVAATQTFEPLESDSELTPFEAPYLHFKVGFDNLRTLEHIPHTNSVLILMDSPDNISYIEQLIGSISLRLDSNIFVAVPNDGFALYEIYTVENRLIMDLYSQWTNFRFSWFPSYSKWERRSNLNGMNIKIAALPSRPYLDLDCHNTSLNNCTISGMYADVFFVLRDILNFTYQFVQPPDDTWGTSDSEGAYNGMLGQLQRQEIDLAPTSFTVTKERSRVVDFAFPITDMHHRFFVPKPRDRVNWTAYTDPLANSVWSVLGILSLTVPFLLWTSVVLKNDPQKAQFKLYRSFAFIAMTLTFAKPWSSVPQTYVPKVMFLLVSLAGSLIYWHWEAMLISFLAVKTKALPFNNFLNLMEDTNLKIALLPGTSFADTFRLSPDSLWRTAWAERIEPHLNTYPTDKESLVELIISDRQFTLFDNYYSIKTFQAYKTCQIVDIPQAYESKVFSYAFAKNSPYFQVFNYYLRVMKESGGLDQIIRRYVTDEQPICSETSAALGLENCFTALLILGLGILISLVCFGFERNNARFRSWLKYFHDDDDEASDDMDQDDEKNLEEDSALRLQLHLARKLRLQSKHIDALEGEISFLRGELIKGKKGIPTTTTMTKQF